MKWIVALILTLVCAVPSSAYAAGSWRFDDYWVDLTVDRWTNKPDICQQNFPTSDAAIACINANGENQALWSTSPSAAYITFAVTLGAQTGIPNRRAANILPNDVTYVVNGTAKVYSSSNTIISICSFGNTTKFQYGSGSCSGTFIGTGGASSLFRLVYNPGIEPDPEENTCLNDGEPITVAMWTSTTATGTEPIRVEGYECEFTKAAGGTVGGGPGSVSLCFPASGYTVTTADGTVVDYELCNLGTTGEILPPGEGRPSLGYSAAQLSNRVDNAPPDSALNGMTVNTPTMVNGRDILDAAMVDAICEEEGVGTTICLQINETTIQRTTYDGCTIRTYYHFGNRSDTGYCTESFDRDWPTEPVDTAPTFDPDKAFRWDDSPTPATRSDVDTGKLSAISDTTGRPVTAGSKANNGSTIQYPISAGGGTSTSNPPDPDASEPGPTYGETTSDELYTQTSDEDADGGPFAAAWSDFEAGFMSTSFVQSFNSYKITGTAGTGDICWQIDSTALGFATAPLCLEDQYINLAKILLIFAALWYARGLVLGG